MTSRLIKNFGAARLEYDRGRFDDWCIYLSAPPALRRAPRDIDYFARLQHLDTTYGGVYADFVKVYDCARNTLDSRVLAGISRLACRYRTDKTNHVLDFDVLMTTVYAGMVAEEVKAGTRLGKRIKRLGLHQVLKLEMSAAEAASFSRGRRAHELDRLCRSFGF